MRYYMIYCDIHDEDILEPNFTQKAVEFFCNFLGIEKCDLHLMVDDTMNAYGKCFELGSEFCIAVNSEHRSITEIFQTIAHELVHVKQFIKEDLRKHADNGKDIPYYERWWEIEAYKLETEMVLALTEHIKRNRDAQI